MPGLTLGAETGFDRPRLVTKKILAATASTGTSNVSSSCAYRKMTTPAGMSCLRTGVVQSTYYLSTHSLSTHYPI